MLKSSVQHRILKTLPDDRPITAIQIIENLEKCPRGFYPISRTYDQDQDADLRESSIFKSSSARYLCLSKTEGLPNFVVQEIFILTDKYNPPKGFSLLNRTADSEQKAWKKKQLCYRLVNSKDTKVAITDIIVCSRLKKAPEGFKLAGSPSKLRVQELPTKSPFIIAVSILKEAYNCIVIIDGIGFSIWVPNQKNNFFTWRMVDQSMADANDFWSLVIRNKEILKQCELNGVTICFKMGNVQDSQSSPEATSNGRNPAPAPPFTRPAPPVAGSPMYPPLADGGDHDYEILKPGGYGPSGPTRPAPRPPPPVPVSQNSTHTLSNSYQGLEGVPFIVNPKFLTASTADKYQFPVVRAKTMAQILKEYDYPFTVERQTSAI